MRLDIPLFDESRLEEYFPVPEAGGLRVQLSLIHI